MARPRKNFGKGSLKNLACKCGKVHKVADETTEVTCDTCFLKLCPIDCSKDVDKLIQASQQENKVKGKRGRPRNVENESVESSEDNFDSTNDIEVVEDVKIKRGRGRPRKNAVLSADKKGKRMDNVEKKVDVKGGTGKRGRKATVGSAVLGFIKGQSGEVKFTDILNIYTQEREKLGKKATPEVESRNCHSTLYVMVRDGKIREVAKKSVYAAI
jgi:hypothetical protein